MEFQLIYEGKLPSNGNKEDKSKIREQLHLQLKKLWTLPPLSYVSSYKEETKDAGITPFKYNSDPLAYDCGKEPCLVETVSDCKFIPIVHESLNLSAELDIFINFSPSDEDADNVSNFIKQCGDIDNKLKTLLDGLKIPDSNQLPNQWAESWLQKGRHEMYCLLQDDRLISSLSTKVAHTCLLPYDEDESGPKARVIIDVKTKAKVGTFYNLPFM